MAELSHWKISPWEEKGVEKSKWAEEEIKEKKILHKQKILNEKKNLLHEGVMRGGYGREEVRD